MHHINKPPIKATKRRAAKPTMPVKVSQQTIKELPHRQAIKQSNRSTTNKARKHDHGAIHRRIQRSCERVQFQALVTQPNPQHPPPHCLESASSMNIYIYIYILEKHLSLYIYIYIYIYMCECPKQTGGS